MVTRRERDYWQQDHLNLKEKSGITTSFKKDMNPFEGRNPFENTTSQTRYTFVVAWQLRDKEHLV